LRIEGRFPITGFTCGNGWAKERSMYFAARFSRPFEEGRSSATASRQVPLRYIRLRFPARNEAAGTTLHFLPIHDPSDQGSKRRLPISAVRAAKAPQNLETEMPGCGFEKMRADTRADMDRELGGWRSKERREARHVLHAPLSCISVTNLYRMHNGEYAV